MLPNDQQIPQQGLKEGKEGRGLKLQIPSTDRVEHILARKIPHKIRHRGVRRVAAPTHVEQPPKDPKYLQDDLNRRERYEMECAHGIYDGDGLTPIQLVWLHQPNDNLASSQSEEPTDHNVASRAGNLSISTDALTSIVDDGSIMTDASNAQTVEENVIRRQKKQRRIFSGISRMTGFRKKKSMNSIGPRFDTLSESSNTSEDISDISNYSERQRNVDDSSREESYGSIFVSDYVYNPGMGRSTLRSEVFR